MRSSVKPHLCVINLHFSPHSVVDFGRTLAPRLSMNVSFSLSWSRGGFDRLGPFPDFRVKLLTGPVLVNDSHFK